MVTDKDFIVTEWYVRINTVHFRDETIGLTFQNGMVQLVSLFWHVLLWYKLLCSRWRSCCMPSDTDHDDVIQWKHFPRYWLFVRGIHRSPMIAPHKGHWRKALLFSLIYAWTNGWVKNRDAGNLRRHRAHYDVTLMTLWMTQRTTLTS